MKKVGISTVYTGYNYGSALQAFATKTILEKLGYESELFSIRGSLIKGRDVRLKKLLLIILRLLKHPLDMKRSFHTYNANIKKPLPDAAIKMFEDFTIKHLKPLQITYRQIKKIASDPSYVAFLCGSDQIWNSTTYYVDPFYYLRYAPKEKRIAFAPSFGRNFIPKYNEKKIKKYVSDIPHLSIRENSGATLIRSLTKRDSTVLLDPTLILSKEEWIESLQLSTISNKTPYILAYFLDYPSQKAINLMNILSKKTGYPIVGIPYLYENADWCDRIELAGPIEFLNLILNAAVVYTDSFHGTAFSINFNIAFITFNRNYGDAPNQSARIVSMLEHFGLLNRFINSYKSKEVDFPINYKVVNEKLSEIRKKSIGFLSDALEKVQRRTGIE